MNGNQSYIQQYQYQKQQQQQQLLKQQNTQVEELRFEVYQDLQFTINLFYSLIGTIDYFDECPEHPMITTSINKLITQLNLSNTIHSHQQNIHQQNQQQQRDINKKALKIFNDIILNQKLQYFMEYIKFFKENLSDHVVQRSLKLVDTNRDVEFSQDVVQRVIGAMNTTDNRYKSLKKESRMQSPTKAQVQQKAEEYQQFTLELLKKNFPKGQQQTQQQQQVQQPNNQKRTYDFVAQTKSQIYQSQNKQPNKTR